MDISVAPIMTSQTLAARHKDARKNAALPDTEPTSMPTAGPSSTPQHADYAEDESIFPRIGRLEIQLEYIMRMNEEMCRHMQIDTSRLRPVDPAVDSSTEDLEDDDEDEDEE